MSTRDLMLIAAIGAAFGVLYRFFAPIHETYSGVFGEVLGQWDYGIWFMAGLLAAVILQRPGAVLAAESLAGALSVLLGSPWGFLVFPAAALQGLAGEAVFAVGSWRRYGYGWMAAAGGFTGVAAFCFDYVVYDYHAFAPWIKTGRLGLMIASGALLGGVGSRAIALRLAKTGAIDQTALGRKAQLTVDS